MVRRRDVRRGLRDRLCRRARGDTPARRGLRLLRRRVRKGVAARPGLFVVTAARAGARRDGRDDEGRG